MDPFPRFQHSARRVGFLLAPRNLTTESRLKCLPSPEGMNGALIRCDKVLFPWCATLSPPFVPQVDHLSDVMLHVRGALHDHVQPVRGVRAHPRVFF